MSLAPPGEKTVYQEVGALRTQVIDLQCHVRTLWDRVQRLEAATGVATADDYNPPTGPDGEGEDS